MDSVAKPITFTLRLNLRLGSRHEAVTTTDGGYLEVKRRMFGMAAVVEYALVSLLALKYGDQRGAFRVALSKVSTKSTLSGLKRLHIFTSGLYTDHSSRKLLRAVAWKLGLAAMYNRQNRL